MIKNYFTIAWRNISRRKTYTFINILGLSLGICICIVIYLIAHFELATDRFHPGRQRIYRVVEVVKDHNAPVEEAASAPVDLSLMAGNRLTGVETITSYALYAASIEIQGKDHKKVRFDNEVEGSHLPSTILAGPEYFRIFQYKWLAGNPATALAAPNTVVLTRSKALKYFGNGSPQEWIGRNLTFNDSLTVRVTGIIRDWTAPTDLPFTEFISFSSRNGGFLREKLFPEGGHNGFSPFFSRAFVQLLPGSSPVRVNAQIHALAKLHPSEPGIRYDLTLQPLSDIHFYAGIADGIHKAHLPTLYTLMGIGIFILLLAAINFINLSTALSLHRAKEIGIRKVIGSGRLNIAFQFLTETFLVTLAALLIALAAVSPVLSAFQTWIPKGVTAHLLDPVNGIFLILLVLVTTLLAGFYPARVLSGYLPVLSLKGAVSMRGRGKGYFRKSLIVFQFAISLVFIISTIIIGRQIDYMRTTDLGFNTDAVLSVFAHPQDRTPRVALFAERVRRLPGVLNVARQSFMPLSDFQANMQVTYKGRRDQEIPSAIQLADSNFIRLYDIHLLAGRNLREAVDRDSIQEFVINESLRKAAGFKSPESAIGQMLYLDNHGFPIVGVVADFHENDYRLPIRPLVIFDLVQPENNFAIKLAARGKNLVAVNHTLADIQRVWKEIYPDVPFSYTFLDDDIAAMYRNEQKTATLMNVAAAITIFISCMGLFGLSLFTAGQRSKEISIRKVLGAGVVQITSLLTRDFLLLIGLSLMIASPVAWYITHRWLGDFVYRAPVGVWIFVLSGSLVLLVGLLTVSGQTIRAATARPVKNLRSE